MATACRRRVGWWLPAGQPGADGAVQGVGVDAGQHGDKRVPSAASVA
jgi:hypothetical protein